MSSQQSFEEYPTLSFEQEQDKSQKWKTSPPKRTKTVRSVGSPIMHRVSAIVERLGHVGVAHVA